MKFPLALSALTLTKSALIVTHRGRRRICELCKLDIIHRKATARMSWICNLDFIVNIKPFWMMIHFLSLQCYSCHETKRAIEVFENEFFVNRISPIDHFPPILKQRFQLCLPFSLVKFSRSCGLNRISRNNFDMKK